MHRGTAFIITKDKNNKFLVQKSTEFNGGMGLDCYGKTMYEILQKLKDPLLFDTIIREFDNKYFKYNDKVMTYSPEEQKRPYIDENGNEYFEYSQTENQFKFFKDDNGEYIYTSDSNYIKNMANEDITIVCSNGNYLLKPNQILIADYNECINNIKKTFGKEINKNIQIDELKTKEYIPTKKQQVILDNIIKTIESFNFRVDLLYENGMANGMEIETWTDGGVDMIHTFSFYDDFQNLYNVNEVNKQLKEIYENFNIDEEIDIYRQNEDYKNHFTIKDSLNDFETYDKRLEDLSNNFKTKYHELLYKKFINNEIEEEIDI